MSEPSGKDGIEVELQGVFGRLGPMGTPGYKGPNGFQGSNRPAGAGDRGLSRSSAPKGFQGMPGPSGNHTAQHYLFIGVNVGVTEIWCRSMLYTSLGRLLMVDIEEDEDKFEAFSVVTLGNGKLLKGSLILKETRKKLIGQLHLTHFRHQWMRNPCCLKRDKIKKVTQQVLDELTSYVGRSPRSCLPNSLTRFVDLRPEDEILSKDVVYKKLNIPGVISESRSSEDGSCKSLFIERGDGSTVTRNSKFLKAEFSETLGLGLKIQDWGCQVQVLVSVLTEFTSQDQSWYWSRLKFCFKTCLGLGLI